jgi:hypothetical protein
MKIRDRRERATGRQGNRSEQFARLTQSLLESEAVATLPPTTFKLLTLLALGARPPGMDPRKDKGRNGVQAITGSHARRFGMSSRDTVYRGIETLIERGLIIKTREGWKSKTHFALYAVAWLPVTHRDGEPLDTPERANDAWRTWTQIPKPKKKTPKRSRPMIGHDQAQATINLPSDSRTQSRPMIGHDGAGSRPMVRLEGPLSRPMVGNTLRILEGIPTEPTAPRVDGSRGLKPDPNPPDSLTALPQKKFADSDIANDLPEEIQYVRREGL